MAKEIAVFASGCFWCYQPIFEKVNGVNIVEVGYCGGDTENPNYEQVIAGKTGHAESYKIEFDPGVIDYLDLLKIFFDVHDPTTLNKQGADVGTQYRSAIFYVKEAQKAKAEAYINFLEEERIYNNPIITQLVQLSVFYQAEDYHQHYFEKNPYAGYCQFVINPKLKKASGIIGEINKINYSRE